MDSMDKIFKGQDPEKVMPIIATMLGDVLKAADLEDDRIVEGFMAGNTAAQTIGLSREELEILYAAGFNFLNQGDLKKAQDTFVTLTMIDPLEAKNHYCLGLSYQLQGNQKLAADMYINFLALDATNPDGYLRYGECLMALGEKAEARDAFEIALAEAEKGNGGPGSKAEAQAKLAILTGETSQ